ncbi:MAG: CRTAC1 family protein [Bryobacteraceae bacterium]
MRLALWPVAAWFAAATQAGSPLYREVTSAKSGIVWTHESARSDKRYLPETSGPGVAIFDFDNDGRMDILVVNSGTSGFYTPKSPLHHALYHNNGDGTFSDVTLKAGITSDLFAQGIAVGDYDGDGWPDVLITGVGKLVLYHNNSNGTFSDVTASSGLEAPQWGTSAVWFDYDNDGKLDLFVAEFADYRKPRVCSREEAYGANDVPGGVETKVQSYYCHPEYLTPWPSRLYHNLGSGKFVDVSHRTGIDSKAGKAWGVIAADINGDGYMDLFVANDTMVNYLWVNRHGEKFEEIGLESGVGYSANGMPRAGMGVDAGDFDRDGKVDLVVANINPQTTSLYRNIGDEMFEDINMKTGLAPATRMYSGWGLGFLDYDNDGWLDLIMTNGHPNDLIDQAKIGFTYREPMLLMRNIGGEKLENVSGQAGDAFQKDYAARSLAIGDLNNDGYPDFVFTENGGPVHVLMNSGGGNHWLGLRLLAKTANPAAAGATIRWNAGGKTYSRLKNAGGSYLSTNDPREVIGAGNTRIDWVEVRWPAPSARVDRIEAPPMDRYITVTEGQGTSGK